MSAPDKKKRRVDDTLPDTVTLPVHRFLRSQRLSLSYVEQQLPSMRRLATDARQFNKDAGAFGLEILETHVADVKDNMQAALDGRPDLRGRYSGDIRQIDSQMAKVSNLKLEWTTAAGPTYATEQVVAGEESEEEPC